MRKIPGVILALSLLLMIHATSYAAPPVEGFLGVSWGTGLEQIDRAMTAQGFSGKTVLNQGSAVRYRGNFEGYPAYVVFSLWNNHFYRVTVSGICQVWDKDRSSEVGECFGRLQALFTQQYGQATDEAGPPETRVTYWNKLAGPAGQKDELRLILLRHLPEGGLTEGSVEVLFENRRLQTCLYSQMMGRMPPGDCPVK